MPSPNPLISKLPSGLLLWLLRLPIALYHLKLGWLLGQSFLLLEHGGRTSGQVRQTVVEVIGHDHASDTTLSPLVGKQANWYQNLLATPAITIRVGRRHLHVCAETLLLAAGVRVLLDYCQKHPLATRELSHLLVGVNLTQASPEELEGIVQESLPIVALRPQGGNAAS